MPVVLLAADLVGRAAAECDPMERVKRDLRVRDGCADRLLVAGRHVDRDRPDRRSLRVGQLVEEALQGRGVAAGRRPHHAAGLVVSDAGQEAMLRRVGHLVDADHHQPVQPPAVELVGMTRSRTFPTDRHEIRISFASGVRAICWARNATTSSRSRV
jgi:hypothetical protein